VPGPAERVVPVPKFVPVPPVPVHQVTTAPVPATPLAVSVVETFTQMGFAAAVTEVMVGSVLTVIVPVAVTAVQELPVEVTV
jgi:hypothetical protein